MFEPKTEAAGVHHDQVVQRNMSEIEYTGLFVVPPRNA
jgi:hypothetical protein